MIETLLRQAESIAIDAGQWIAKQHGSFDLVDYKKNHLDVVTDVDRAAEERINQQIRLRFPEHAILSEEQQAGQTDYGSLDQQSYCWIVDPIDGTVNYIHDVAYYSVSIGIVKDGQLVAGVVYDPNRNELFSAGRGLGAFMNGRRLGVSSRSLQESLLHTGYAATDWTTDSPLRYEFAKVYALPRNIKIAGSASLDLAYVACGRVDGFWQRRLSPWDIAAGTLLVTEAGGTVSDLDGSALNLKEGNILASNGHIHNQLILMINEEA
ncbi:inositol monophosphatase [Paenibacillus polysaccharolyticus]|uniref:inositol monophosphatase family protein n=1 Tax=Paenibacillus polysaccharolyticus TaxID=582692 RepID=UPI0020A17A4F|nr:inositol monophosphatase family protein [Paenibacillus polysaccharolyticus]MCP1136202.1 inositol monophosphatase [Paenibacillus polysaccharolyticus]